MTAVFTRVGTSVVEVRGNNATKSYANNWHPAVSRFSGFDYFWWGIIVQDPSMVSVSRLESKGGFYADSSSSWKSAMFRKRDQNVELRGGLENFPWAVLLPGGVNRSSFDGSTSRRSSGRSPPSVETRRPTASSSAPTWSSLAARSTEASSSR